MFTGIPEAAFDYYEQLEIENSREFFSSHKAIYDDAVRAPIAALCQALEPEFGAAKIFRPNRDVRFSQDKSPYKTHQGAYVPAGPALGWYLEVSAAGFRVGAGFYHADASGLKALRERIDSPMGAELERRIAALTSQGWEIGGDTVKTAPRGYGVDHPRIALLRHKTLALALPYGNDPVVHTPALVGRVRSDWEAATPVVEWLADVLAPR